MRLRAFIAAAAAALSVSALFGAGTAAAQEDTRVVLRPGDGIQFVDQTNDGWCSIAAAGRDNQGRLIALTAGHCVDKSWIGGNNKPVFKHGSPEIIGRTTPVYNGGSLDWFKFAITNDQPDYAALVLDETKVRYEPTSAVDAQGESVTVTGIRSWSSTGTTNIGSVCGAGYTSKVYCASASNGIIVRSNLINSYVPRANGDSGGALIGADGRLLGITIGQTVDFPSNASTRIDRVIAEMNKKGSYGAGWTVITEPTP